MALKEQMREGVHGKTKEKSSRTVYEYEKNQRKKTKTEKLKKRGKEGKKIINEGRKNEGNGELKKMSKPSCY